MVVGLSLLDCLTFHHIPGVMSTWDSYGAILAICGSSTSESGFGRFTCFTFILMHSPWGFLFVCVFWVGFCVGLFVWLCFL